MAIWDNLGDIFGGGKESGANDASKYFDPYTQGGAQDYQKFRDYLSKVGGQLDEYGNPAEWMWDQMGENPQDFYQTLMEGYNESPQAEYEREKMMDTVNQGGSASGMLGSGAYYDELQRNTYDIGARDQQRWLDNMLGVNRRQQEYLGDFRGQEGVYRGGLADSARWGMDAAKQQADLARERTQGRGDTWSGIGRAVGGIGQMFF